MKRSYISKRYQEDKSTAMGKSDEMAKAFDDVINLSLGDPDLTSEAIRSFVRQSSTFTRKSTIWT